MKHFWEQSPLWQRAQDLHAEFKRAEEAEDDEGQRVLACIQNDNDSPHGDWWHERRRAYRDAVERRRTAYDAWDAAGRAFDASLVGQAKDRWRRDPPNRSPEAFAPAPEEAAA